jgi:uncharacterized protein (UPF0305 family)
MSNLVVYKRLFKIQLPLKKNLFYYSRNYKRTIFTKKFFITYKWTKLYRVFVPGRPFHPGVMFPGKTRGRIFSHVQPFYERAVSDRDRSMHRALWV